MADVLADAQADALGLRLSPPRALTLAASHLFAVGKARGRFKSSRAIA